MPADRKRAPPPAPVTSHSAWARRERSALQTCRSFLCSHPRRPDLEQPWPGVLCSPLHPGSRRGKKVQKMLETASGSRGGGKNRKIRSKHVGHQSQPPQIAVGRREGCGQSPVAFSSRLFLFSLGARSRPWLRPLPWEDGPSPPGRSP